MRPHRLKASDVSVIQRYKHFRDEQYAKNSKKLCDTITKVNLPKFDDKDKKQKPLQPTVIKLQDAQKHTDVARAIGISTKESCASSISETTHKQYTFLSKI